MTGGSLPAMTWHDIMEYAHQGIELKNLPGLAPNPAPTAPVVASTTKGDTPRPAMLTFRGARVLVALEHLMEDASRAMPAPAAGAAADARPADSRTGPFAQAGGQQGATRGD
jgi:penicillin-binding protein 1A